MSARPNEEDKPSRNSVVEQHIGTVLQVLVIGLLAWSLNTTQGLSNDVAVLKSQVAILTAAIQQGTNDRYRAADATRDLNRVDLDIRRIEERVTRVEARVK